MPPRPQATCPHARQGCTGSNQFQQQIVCKQCGRVLLKLYQDEVGPQLLRACLARARVSPQPRPREVAVQTAALQVARGQPKAWHLLLAFFLGVLLAQFLGGADFLVLLSSSH